MKCNLVQKMTFSLLLRTSRTLLFRDKTRLSPSTLVFGLFCDPNNETIMRMKVIVALGEKREKDIDKEKEWEMANTLCGELGKRGTKRYRGKRGFFVYNETPKSVVESMSMIEELRKLLLLSDGALFLVEFELWNRDTKLSFPKRVSLVTRRRFTTMVENPQYLWEIGMEKDANFKDGLNKTVLDSCI